MHFKGQGAVEYLLILAAAILVVAIVTVGVTNVTGIGLTNIESSSVDTVTNPLLDLFENKSGLTIIVDNPADETDPGNENTGDDDTEGGSITLDSRESSASTCKDEDAEYGDLFQQSKIPSELGITYATDITQDQEILSSLPKDYCLNEITLREMTCENGVKKEIDVDCASKHGDDWTCFEGACVEGEPQ